MKQPKERNGIEFVRERIAVYSYQKYWYRLCFHTKKSLDVLQTFSLEAGVVMLWEDNGGWDVLLDLADEVEASTYQQLLPAMDGAHLGLDCLTGDILGLHQTIILGDSLE